MKKYCLYIKFYLHKLKLIDKWEHILNSINYVNTDVYIWVYDKLKRNIFTYKEIYLLIRKYSKCIFITNYNQNNYLTNSDQNYLEMFKKSILVNNNHKEIAESHLKSFLIPKNIEYIFKLDGDDMFYPNLKIEHLESIIKYMDNNLEIKILTRPFWICHNRGWSFGFTIARNNILDYMNLFKFDYKWIQNHKLSDECCAINLDNLFGQIFIKNNIPIEKLFFLINDCKWENEIENKFIVNNNCIII